MKYEIVEVKDGSEMLKKISEDGIESWIPMSEDNADYQTYLESLKDAAK